MEIHGLNKLTLLDYPGHLGCTIFTGRCNLRCPFCHNASLVLSPENEPTIETDEVLAFLAKRKNTLEGVCITGGEPTLQADLVPFLQQVKAMHFLVKLDTNGTRPDIIEKLLSLQLVDYIAMDIKNQKEKYAETCGVPNIRLECIERSVSMLKASGLPYEFRTTVVSEYHTSEDLLAIGEWLKGSKRYALQAFQDSGRLIRSGLTGHSVDTMLHFKAMLAPYFDEVLLRGVDESLQQTERK